MRLLLVEDHAISWGGLGETAEANGLRRHCRLHFPRGTELCAEQRFGVLLSDIDLPDGNGCDLVVEIRNVIP